MTRNLILATLLAVVSTNSSIVSASIVGGMLSFDGTPDSLADDSLGVFVDTDGDGSADIIQGVINFPSVTNAPPAPGEGVFGATGGNLFAVYSFEIVATSGPLTGSGFEALTFEASGAGTGAFSVASMLSSIGVTVNDSTSVRVAGDAAIAIFSNNDASAFEPESIFTNEAADPFTDPIDLAYSGTATDFDVEVLAGLDGVDDFHSAELVFRDGDFLSGSFDGAYTVFADIFGPGVVYEPITGLDNGVVADIHVVDSSGDPTGSGDITLFDPAPNSGGFTFADSGNFMLNAIPEPSMLLVFIGLGTVGAGSALQRRCRA